MYTLWEQGVEFIHTECIYNTTPIQISFTVEMIIHCWLQGLSKYTGEMFIHTLSTGEMLKTL